MLLELLKAVFTGPMLYRICSLVLLGIIVGWVWWGVKIVSTKQIRAKEKTEEIIKDSTTDIKETIINELENLYKRLQTKDNLQKNNIEKAAKRTYEIAKNRNANLLLKANYEKEGGFGTWFTPMWEGSPQRKFYLFDFVGNLNKNRISVFITEKSKLICQILTSDGRNEKISINIDPWKKNEPHLIIVQWKTIENRVDLFIDEQKYERVIPNLRFDKLGPILFAGIDFEGNFPANFGKGGPKISEGLKSLGLEDFKPKDNN